MNASSPMVRESDFPLAPLPTGKVDVIGLNTVGTSAFRQFLQEHHSRVGELSRIVALAAGLDESHADGVARAGALHDIGKIFVPEAILQRPGPLSDDERQAVQRHSYWGCMILGRSNEPIMELAASVALQHHECWDGSGYPFGISKEAICLEARLVTVCDVYDALRAQRPYKVGYSHEQAMDIILNGDERLTPTMFDPAVLHAFISVHEKCRAQFDGMRVLGDDGVRAAA